MGGSRGLAGPDLDELIRHPSEGARALTGKSDTLSFTSCQDKPEPGALGASNEGSEVIGEPCVIGMKVSGTVSAGSK